MVDDVIAKTKISRINGLPHFFNYGAACGVPLLARLLCWNEQDS